MNNVWTEKKIFELGQVQTGTTPKTSVKSNFGNFIPFIKPADFNKDGTLNYFNDGLSEDGLKFSRLIEKNSVLMVCIGATIGKTGYTTRPIACNQQINSLTLKNGISPKFVYYALINDSFQNEVRSNAGQATLPIINKTKWQNLKIHLPTEQNEQKRIVKILDEAFTAIDKAKANAEKNLANSKELFESYLNGVFANPGKDWKDTTIGNEVDLNCGFAFKSANYTEDSNGIKLLRGDNIVQGELRWVDVKKWPASQANEFSNFDVQAGDVVLAMDRPWVNSGLKRAMIKENDVPCLQVQRTARLRNKSNLNNYFLLFLIESRKFIQHILGSQNGLGVPHISGQQIKSFSFLLPTIIEQQQIVNAITDIRNTTQKLELIYQKKLSELEDLKKSILQKAFSGEL